MPTSDYSCRACNTTFVVAEDPPAQGEAIRCPACGEPAIRTSHGVAGLGHHGHRRAGGHVHAEHERRKRGLGLGCGRGGFR